MPDLPVDWLQRLMVMLSGQHQQGAPGVQGWPVGGMEDQIRKRFAGAFANRQPRMDAPRFPDARDVNRIQPVPNPAPPMPTGGDMKIQPIGPMTPYTPPKLDTPAVPGAGDNHIQPMPTPTPLVGDAPKRKREIPYA